MNKRVIIGLFALALITAGLYYFFFNPASNGYFLACPLKTITTYECPGCGSQRAIHQLLHGNIKSAFLLNPLLVVTIPLIIYALGLQAYNYVYGTSKRVGLFYKNWFIYGYFGIAILFGIIRNTSLYPF